MNANELADELKIMPDFYAPQAAAMLRKQDAAIKQLREALESIQNFYGPLYGHMYLISEAALAATENLHG